MLIKNPRLHETQNMVNDLRRIHRVIPVLIYLFDRDVSTCFPTVCASPAKAPF